MTLPTHILATLDPDEPMTAAQISARIPGSTAAGVYAALRLLERGGRAVSGRNDGLLVWSRP